MCPPPSQRKNLTALSGVENRVDPAEDPAHLVAQRREDSQRQDGQDRQHQRVLDQGLALLSSGHDSAKIASKGLKQGSHWRIDLSNNLSHLRSLDNGRENLNQLAKEDNKGFERLELHESLIPLGCSGAKPLGPVETTISCANRKC